MGGTKLIPQFVCTYYLGLLPKVHSTFLSIQIQDSTPVEREFFFGVPAPGLKTGVSIYSGDVASDHSTKERNTPTRARFCVGYQTHYFDHCQNMSLYHSRWDSRW